MPAVRTSFAYGIASVLWKKIAAVAKDRDQEGRLPEALRAIGCTYLAYQVEQCLSSKKKSYDGSDTLKMTGVDCIRLEEQVEKFVEFFLRPGQAMSDVSCLGLRKLVEMFTLTREITKEMRALTTTTDRIEAFKKNVEKLLQKIKDDCPAECSKCHTCIRCVTMWLHSWSSGTLPSVGAMGIFLVWRRNT